MTDEQTLQLVTRALEQVIPDFNALGVRISRDTGLSDLGMESVAVMEAAGFIEDELGIEFPDVELARVEGVGDIVELIRKFSPQ